MKSRNLSLACYSLTLDALAQEAGALFRPLLESVELLMYFRLDPKRIEEVLEDRLPNAGVVAKRVEGRFRELREYLNTYASHISVSPEAMGHLIDLRAVQLKLVQPFNEAVMRRNLRTLLAVVSSIAIEGVNCILVAESAVDESLATAVEGLHRRIFALHDSPSGDDSPSGVG